MIKVKPTWAGYNNEGNDYKGHMHPLKGGGFFRHDGVEGVFCVAPVNEEGFCTDPSPKAIPMLTCDWCERTLPSTKVDKLHDHWGNWVLNQCKDLKECEAYIKAHPPVFEVRDDIDEIPF